MSNFFESCERFRQVRALAEANLPLPGGKLVKKSHVERPDDPSWDSSKHLARSIPKAAEKLRMLRK
jgi:hypothetical protein